LCGAPPAAAKPSVTLAFVDGGTKPTALQRAGVTSVGAWSAGIGPVSVDQTSLDITQGNRVSDVLYDRQLPSLNTEGSSRVIQSWAEVRSRADSAPAEIVPGLLASVLERSGTHVKGRIQASVNRQGLIGRLPTGPCLAGKGRCTGLTVLGASSITIPQLIDAMGPDDLFIALALPSHMHPQLGYIGIAGGGYRGDLTSDSTRTDGYVLSTDIAPTILRRFALPVPDEMTGDPIRAEGSIDPAGVQDRFARMVAIPDRRAPVVILSLIAWILAAALVAVAAPVLRRSALAWLAIAFAYMPLLLLAGSALEPSAVAEGLLVGFGAAGLAALTVLLVRGWWALAIACAVTVIAYAIDVVAGSGLTKLSLLGPNPIFGARFYGIGNELEALIAVMVPVGVGAALSAVRDTRKPGNEGWAAAAFLGVGLLTAVVFAAGRFGADVGAAIVLPVGVTAAAAVLVGGSVRIRAAAGGQNRHGWAVGAVIAAPILVFALIAAVDLVSGGNSHLTRSVLDAGGASDLADIAQRRLELSADDFAQAARNPLFWLLIAGVAACIAKRRRIDAWLRTAPPARAGFLGACAAVPVGVLVNDSGATFLVLGTLALGATLAFAWAQARPDP
jgi:hypothetical protein